MKNKLLHLGTTFKAATTEEGTVKISGYASTNHKDRAGDVILADAWTKGGLENYSKNPIILFNHNYDRPVGKATSVETTDMGLKLECEISSVASDVAQLVQDGILSTFSVGFRVKDASYDMDEDTYYIKDAELFEVSIVSVPCNQDATFSVAKSFDSEQDYKDFVKQFTPAEPADDSVNAQDSAGQEAKNVDNKEIDMTPEEIKAMLEQVAKDTAKELAASQAKEAAAKAAEKAKADAEAEKLNVAITTGAERLMADVEKRFAEKNDALEAIVAELKTELSEKSEEIMKMRESKRHFSDRQAGDWKKDFEQDIADTFILGLATGKGWGSDSAKKLIEKVNTGSGVEVSSADFEQVVSTTIERDVQNELILAPLFREVMMTSATMKLPIMPDSGYAEFTASNALGTQTAPKGNLSERDGTANAGVDLQERILSVNKLISTSYLGNETEEDAILPILPLIREAMVRSHARSVENAILLGNHADGAFTSGAFDGLITMAAADGNVNVVADAPAALASQYVTAADLFGLRKSMGKYGLRPQDVVYIVSQEGYFNLIEDAEFQDANLVGEGMATKVKGAIGQVFGSPVIVCDEFADKAVDAHCAIAVNTRNFLIPRLRGFRVESDYEVVNQRRVLVATQRLGFIDLFDGVAAKAALAYGDTE